MEERFATVYLICFTIIFVVEAQRGFMEEETASLTGDVQNWAVLLQNYILQLASDGIKKDFTQALFDEAAYEMEVKDGEQLVAQVKEGLGGYFSKKKQAAQRLAEAVVDLHDTWLAANRTPSVHRLPNLPLEVYRDSDIPARLPEQLNFNPYFKQRVSTINSAVKISEEVPRDDTSTIGTVEWSAGLEEVFKQNAQEDEYLRWQYFGSTAGLARFYPGREWDINFAGFYNEYDPRVRSWYIAATSGPKDVLIVLDCSASMSGEKFEIAQAVAKTVINTLTRQDYVNVVCARASHWDDTGKWHVYNTEVLSCQQDRLVPATVSHRKDLIEKIDKLKAGGTSELELGLEAGLKLLSGRQRTGCQSLAVIVTDGQDTDGEKVRCGSGYYTRSGYVSGPICKYNWTKVWEVADRHNMYHQPQTRIFSYLTLDEGEAFPGKLACSHRGTMTKLTSGENLISHMHDYFHFLSANAAQATRQGLWTSPYLDAWGLGLMVTYAIPCVSKIDGRTLGVVGVDATLEDLENYLGRHQWGSVYSFLINRNGETIFHPRLKPSKNLVDDPIFIPIEQLEQVQDKPAAFSQVAEDMRAGRDGHVRIDDARPGRTKDTYEARTFYYASLNDSEYSFAFSLSDTDKVFRRAQEPSDTSHYDQSYFNLLIEYNATEARTQLPGVFQYLEVKSNEVKYPGLRVSYLHSSIFLAPKCHCDANAYFYNDNLAGKTVAAHRYINAQSPDITTRDTIIDQSRHNAISRDAHKYTSTRDTMKEESRDPKRDSSTRYQNNIDMVIYARDLGCGRGGRYEKGTRADVLITQPVERLWRQRAFEGIDDVKWTYVGLRSGVFRTYPAHRSTRGYDPSKRPWYKRAASDPSKTSISTPYMDAAGVGKIITISQAVFEGMISRSNEDCMKISETGPWPGGCSCVRDEDCIAGSCYKSSAPAGVPNRPGPRCATERVEGVTSLDMLYDRFHEIAMATMRASDGVKSCGSNYTCPDGKTTCMTRCYLFDQHASLIMDPTFPHASALDEREYEAVSMGRKEGEVMRDLIYRHRFFQRKEAIDFQGTCSISPYAPKVTLEGIPKNPEELDNYYKNKGPIPKFSNDFGCITDVVGFKANVSQLGPSRMVTGNVTGPCMSGFYYVTVLPKTNLFLLVIEDWRRSSQSLLNFNCKIAQSVVNSGAYRIINGTCAHTDTSTATLAERDACPATRDVTIPCTYNTAATSLGYVAHLLLFIMMVVYMS